MPNARSHPAIPPHPTRPHLEPTSNPPDSSPSCTVPSHPTRSQPMCTPFPSAAPASSCRAPASSCRGVRGPSSHLRFPNFLLPAPCSPLHAPCVLLPASCVLLPASCVLLPAPPSCLASPAHASTTSVYRAQRGVGGPACIEARRSTLSRLPAGAVLHALPPPQAAPPVLPGTPARHPHVCDGPNADVCLPG